MIDLSDLSDLSTRLLDILFLGIALVGSLTIHECAHAWVAYRLGDPTAKYMGRVSLNPLRHLDPIGGLMILFMIVAGVGFGWAKPVPVNPRNLRHGTRDYALVSFSGPLSNVTLGLIVALIIRLVTLVVPVSMLLTDPVGQLVQFLFLVSVVNFGLAVFNLMPIPPLDGFSVLLGILDNLPYRFRWARQLAFTLRQYEPYGPFLLIVLILIGTLGACGFLNVLFSLAEQATLLIAGFS